MTSNGIVELADLGMLPFYIGESETPTNGDLPDLLPFKVGFKSDINLMVQVPDVRVQQHLARAYQKGSIIGTPMSEEGIGRNYAEDFLAFINRAVGLDALRGLRVLEIGCGTGYLLHRVRELGAEVLGIEPGAQGQAGAQKYGLRIIHGMFPDREIISRGQFDLIINYGVLEHVVNPVQFLEEQTRSLTEVGKIIFAVPDCTEYIDTADISMFLHEHWSYFSTHSLAALVKSVGLHAICVEKSSYGGALYGVAGKRGRSSQGEQEADESVELFAARLNQTIERATAFFTAAARSRSSVGIFCPGRILNLLHVIQPHVAVRFFDDDERLLGKYYPPLSVPIESRQDLLERPVDELIIMSRSFGSRLLSELSREEVANRTRFSLPGDLLGS
jgi:2-polyprenyl-3-methyl-5-hydroxy-6-metoxy-1,4-benzoquinol methylase